MTPLDYYNKVIGRIGWGPGYLTAMYEACRTISGAARSGKRIFIRDDGPEITVIGRHVPPYVEVDLTGDGNAQGFDPRAFYAPGPLELLARILDPDE